MHSLRTRRFTAGAVVMALLGSLFSLIVMQPAQAATCGTSTITLALSKNGLIRAGTATGPTGTLVATATLTEGGNADPLKTVTFIITGDNTASVSPNPVVTSEDPTQPSPPFTPGQYKTTVTAGSNPGSFTLTATYVNNAGATCSDSKTVTQFGDPVAVSLVLNPTAVPVSGLTTSTSTATATVSDAGGRRVNDLAVTFTVETPDPSTAAKASVASRPPTSSNNLGDGTYRETINASSDPSRQTIKATVTGNPSGTTPAVNSPSGSATLVQFGDPASIALSFSPTSLVANGVSFVTASALVLDSVGNPVPGETVSFLRTTGPVVTFDPATATATTDAGGTARINVGGATQSGTANITALTDTGSKQNTQDLAVVAPVPTTVSMTLTPSSVPADGKSTSTAIITVRDQVGVRLTGATVAVNRPGRAAIAATDQDDGSYKATVVAASAPASESLTATATKSGISKTSGVAIFASTAAATTTTTTPPPEDVSKDQGYTLVGSDGGIFTFGTSKFHGSTGDLKLNQPVIGLANKPGGTGYWLVAKDGGIFTFGDAGFFGSTGDLKLNAPILGMEATPSGQGYYLFAADGGIFTFGDAKFFGSTGDMKLNAPAVGLAINEKGDGYWLVAQDGGIFSFGNVPFHGSTGGMKLNQPVFDMTPTAGDKGYFLVAKDGGVFSFGDAEGKFAGSASGATNSPVIGIGITPSFNGYWISDAAGAVFPFGDARFLGDRRGQTNNGTIVGFATVPKK